MHTSWIPQLTSDRSRLAPRHGKHAKARRGRGQLQKGRFKPRVEVLEDRAAPAIAILNGGGLGYAGDPNGNDPPDTCGAAGPSSYIEATNINLRIYTPKATGATVVSHSINDFFYNPAIGNETKIDAGSCGTCDSTIIFDNLMGGDGRFIVGEIDVDQVTNVSQYIFAVSTSSNPTALDAANWNFYHITTTETSGSTTNWTDYPGNFGFNADAVVETFNEAHGGFLTGTSQILSINASDLAAGVSNASLHSFHNDITTSNNFRPTNMHDSVTGDPMWLIHNPNDGTHIQVVRMDSVLSSAAVLTTTSLTLPAADTFMTGFTKPLNPDGTAINDGTGSRIMKAGEFNNIIVATHTVLVSATELDAQWYAIDVSGATPAFQLVGGVANVGRIGFGANTYIDYPGIDINSAGQIGLSFDESDTVGGAANSATKGFWSTFVTGRKPTEAAGTMEASVLVPAGTGSGNVTDRAGDFSGMNVDPVNGTFWAANEFGNGGNPADDIANIDIAPVVTPPAPQNAVEGASQLFSLGSFTDAAGGPWTVDVSWGDGTPDTVFTATSPGTITAQMHTYAEEGPYTGSITVTDTAENQFDSQPFTVTVSDPAVIAGGVDVSAKECIGFNLPVATFTDPGGAEPNSFDPTPGISSHYTATVDFGDGKGPVAATITYNGVPGDDSTTNTFTVTASHAFDEEGTFNITTTINHEGIITVATSTATVRDNYGLLLLDPTGTQSLMVTGNGTVTVNNCGAIVVDSSDPQAIFLTGNAVATATEADVGLGGGFVTHGKAVLNLLEPEFNQEAATPDPIALPLPPAPPIVSATPLHISSGAVTLSPGTYVGGIVIDGTASVTLLAGVYYMNGGGFLVSGHGSVTDNGAGVLLVNAPAGPNDVISITGQGSVSLTASSSLTGGLAPYNHIVIFQDPASTNPVTVTGQANLAASGTLYAPAALLKINGNATAVVSTDTNSTGGQVIVFDAMIAVNGALTINADPASPVAVAAAPVSASLSAGDNSLRQVSLVLTGGQSLAGASLPSPLVAPAPAGAPAPTPSAAGAAYFLNTGTTAVALSGASAGGQADDWLAASLDAPSDQPRSGL
jgi:hypothetical protein